MQFNKFHLIVIIVASIIYAVTAINSHGYYHPDEHYQIIEFATIKLGYSMHNGIAWEYDYQIRSAIQPALCYALFSLFDVLGITDPYQLATCLRLITAMLAIFAIRYFSLSSLPFIQERFRKLFIICAYLLWFLPFLNVRFSSETWSGLFLILAIALLQNNVDKGPRHFLILGCLLGFSFLFRFQTIIPATGLMCWMIFIARERMKHILLVLAGGTAIILLGILIDMWFYGNFVLTSWNYFYVNIVEDVSSDFGVSPWYYYVPNIMQYASYPLGVAILLSFVILGIRKRKNLYIWVILPFFIIHSIIPHKELRFLFPVANLVPVILILALQEISAIKFMKLGKPVLYLLALPFALINITGLVVAASKTPEDGNKTMTRFIKREYGDNPCVLIFARYANPFNPYTTIRERFYAPKQLEEVSLDLLTDFDVKSIMSNKNVTKLLTIREWDRENKNYTKVITALGFKEIARSVPEWIEWINKYYDEDLNSRTLLLYRSDSHIIQPLHLEQQ